ncbi:HNH endonuclease [Halorientalis persicus]|uniref:HNH endonuclease n=1 Tax=Halorientalis persicus TaxID=1367881 RepID=A0A1H8S1H5_9EURY|nr:HNH endonuclease signature motif containing protein [Halorientalis persicus]SEO72510.1 HNH endonuclease [Halorientalis persicus]
MSEAERERMSQTRREIVLTRDEDECRYCGVGEPVASLEVHHIKPASAGGNNEKDNLLTLCERCHNAIHRIAPDDVEELDLSILEEAKDVFRPDDRERAVLDVFREEERANPMRVRDVTDLRKQYVNDALNQLQKLGVVQKLNRGLYEYVPEEDDLPGAPETLDEGARRVLDEIETAMRRGDRAALQDAISRLEVDDA